jgi:hypothetical protein
VRARSRGLIGLTMAALLIAAGPGVIRAGSLSRQTGSGPSGDPVQMVRIYYGAPALVRAGEAVAMPVHVVCATREGRACNATVSLGVRAGTGDAWRVKTVKAGPGLVFDLSAPAARAAATSGDPSVEFSLGAKAGGMTARLPADGAGQPLRFYVTRGMRTLIVPTIPFGRIRQGRTVLFLPWGSGSKRAGLELGRESPTLGPSSFEVDRGGRVHLLDALQDRIAEFSDGRLVRDWTVQASASSDLALGKDGTAYVADVLNGVVTVRRLAPSGRGVGSVSLGPGVLSQIRAVGTTAHAELLPLDAWVRVPSFGGVARPQAPIVGRPLASGERLLRVGTEQYVRLGTVRRGRVLGAVELRTADRFGEVALAEPDGSGGYLAVVRVWRSTPGPADQFQVIRVSVGRVAETFAVSSRGFANTPPLSRFRLGRDGHLYQLVTGSDGIRIVRFDLKGES